MKQNLMMQVFGSFPLRISVMFLCIFSNLKVRSQIEDYDGQPRATIGTLVPLYASDGSTIVSPGRKFELGFFSPGNSGNSYVGIWYYDSPETIVWIANRQRPIREGSGSKLVVGEEGCLNLYSGLDGMMRIAWGYIVRAELLDDGNLNLISENNEVVWQSFDHPTDTWLPGGELGILTSWKHHDDPAPGVYSFGMYPGGNPELLLWKNSSGLILWRSGVWNGSNFNSFSIGQANFSYIRKKQAKYFTYNVPASLTGRFAMTKEGQINLWVRAENQKWRLHVSILAEDCNRFGFCGPNGVCSTLSVPTCSCFKGFKIRSPKQWKSANWSGGCIRIRPLQCSNTEFFYFSNVSMPANAKSMNSESRKVCQYACLGNCSCNAYAYSDGKCSLWYGDLLNTVVGGRISLGNLYVRLENKKLSNALLAAFITIPVLICISLIYILWHIWRRRHNKKEYMFASTDLLTSISLLVEFYNTRKNR
ncbi:G-type lectin S-receptor-like serine/threonine-protein kinase At2g19130 [Daucus carota subsp. sativus]|uniref:G-type lectin S-receptor-like serine/threonine-protein kinase At2g19130 n=1 Tax=Daucus carota subsp. sativus TaxID=79200 RepID=UPI0007EF873C|nr:PREDICTED: G-type lectin S-receptor-like serine/threonine-protein kinase At2g19130 isoform X5 [Daucus carota subsp. sativus]